MQWTLIYPFLPNLFTWHLIYQFPLVILCTCFWPPFWIPFWHWCDSVVICGYILSFSNSLLKYHRNLCVNFCLNPEGGGDLNLPLEGITNILHYCKGQRMISYQNYASLIESINVIFINHIYLVLKLKNILKYYL